MTNEHERVMKEIYRVIDSFLVEAKDQNGNDRSLDRLNADRHIAADALLELFEKHSHKLLTKVREEERERIASGLWLYRMLRSEDDTDEDRKIMKHVDETLDRIRSSLIHQKQEELSALSKKV